MAAKADEPARGDHELEIDAAAPLVDEIHHPPFSRRDLLRHHACEFLGDVQEKALRRLEELSIFPAGDGGGPGNHELVALPAHRLDEDGHLQLSPPAHLEGIGPIHHGVYPDGDVAERLPLEALPQVARGEVLPFAAREGAVVDVEDHGDGGLVDPDAGQGLRILQGGNRIPDADAGHAGNGDDVA